MPGKISADKKSKNCMLHKKREGMRHSKSSHPSATRLGPVNAEQGSLPRRNQIIFRDILCVMSFSEFFADKVLLAVVIATTAALLAALLLGVKSKGRRLAAAALFGLFVIGLGLSYYLYPNRVAKSRLALTGTVVDESSNAAIPGAEISVVGGTETCVSESNGNFRLKLTGTAEPPGQVRLRVRKIGYQLLDQSVTPPSDDIILLLKKTVR